MFLNIIRPIEFALVGTKCKKKVPSVWEKYYVLRTRGTLLNIALCFIFVCQDISSE